MGTATRSSCLVSTLCSSSVHQRLTAHGREALEASKAAAHEAHAANPFREWVLAAGVQVLGLLPTTKSHCRGESEAPQKSIGLFFPGGHHSLAAFASEMRSAKCLEDPHEH